MKHLFRGVVLDAYARVAGHCRRIVETLGLRRVAKDVTPSLHEIIAKHNEASRKAEKAQGEAAQGA